MRLDYTPENNSNHPEAIFSVLSLRWSRTFVLNFLRMDQYSKMTSLSDVRKPNTSLNKFT